LFGRLLELTLDGAELSFTVDGQIGGKIKPLDFKKADLHIAFDFGPWSLVVFYDTGQTYRLITCAGDAHRLINLYKTSVALWIDEKRFAIQTFRSEIANKERCISGALREKTAKSRVAYLAVCSKLIAAYRHKGLNPALRVLRDIERTSKDPTQDHESWEKLNAPLISSMPTVRSLLRQIPELPGIVRDMKRLESSRHSRRLGADRILRRQRRRFARWYLTNTGIWLSGEQQIACVEQSRATLVVAGAGTGKSELLKAVVAVLDFRGVKRSDILILVYNKKPRRELTERLRRLKRLKRHRARTFHSLAYLVVARSMGRRRLPMSPFNVRDQVDGDEKKPLMDWTLGVFESMVSDPRRGAALRAFLARGLQAEVRVADFNTLGGYYRYLRSNGPITLSGTKVRSYQECAVANFYTLNGIEWKYEPLFQPEHPDVVSYHPDFGLLPLHENGPNVYHEHFGIDGKQRTAPGIDANDYKAQRIWKRGRHSEYGSRLIETTSADYNEGKLEQRILEQLPGDIPRSSLSAEKLRELFRAFDKAKTLPKTVWTFIDRMRAARLGFDDLRRTASDEQRRFRDRLRISLMIDLAEELYCEYRAHLGERLDFTDLIHKATDLLETEEVPLRFANVLVDEYQDITADRLRLLRAIVRAGDSSILAVGDDRQAIYGWSGSDSDSMRQFGSNFGPHALRFLSRTNRFDYGLALPTSIFISMNPAQIDRPIAARPWNGLPSIVVIVGDELAAMTYIFEEILAEFAGKPEVLILSRTGKADSLPLDARSRTTLRQSSVHSAKGLDVDYAILRDMRGGSYGFPRLVPEEPALEVFSSPDEYPHAEERRVFYVALTRARLRTYIIQPSGHPSSCFVDELLALGIASVERREVQAAAEADSVGHCTICGDGKLRLVRSGKAYICQSWEFCGGRYARCDACGAALLPNDGQMVCAGCGETAVACPRCTGSLRKGQYGGYYCSNRMGSHYFSCDYTRQM